MEMLDVTSEIFSMNIFMISVADATECWIWYLMFLANAAFMHRIIYPSLHLNLCDTCSMVKL